jgi:gliding motility-associated lipoprotein GldH
MTSLKKIFLFFIISSFVACDTIDIYERNVTIPGFKWKSSFQPGFSFTIKDTTSPYQVFLVLRHNEKYNYNNIWVNFYSQPPGDTLHKLPFEAVLADKDRWLASGMDDIYEHRIKLFEKPVFLKAGVYRFKIEQIMREDPLENVMNVGLRIEKNK